MPCVAKETNNLISKTEKRQNDKLARVENKQSIPSKGLTNTKIYTIDSENFLMLYEQLEMMCKELQMMWMRQKTILSYSIHEAEI